MLAMNDVTQILSRIETGDAAAAEQLLPLVDDEFRKLAASRLVNSIGIISVVLPAILGRQR